MLRRLALLPLLFSLGSTPSAEKVFLTTQQALERAFPDCEVERKSFTLTKAQRVHIEKESGSKLRSSIVRAYIARKKGRVVGTAYFDAHRVRTLREVLMIVVTGSRAIDRVDMLAFGEPLDYIPRGRWYAQFVGRKLDEDLRLRRGIDGVTGATLTARATTRCARRILATHDVVFPRPKKEKPAR